MNYLSPNERQEKYSSTKPTIFFDERFYRPLQSRHQFVSFDDSKLSTDLLSSTRIYTLPYTNENRTKLRITEADSPRGKRSARKQTEGWQKVRRGKGKRSRRQGRS